MANPSLTKKWCNFRIEGYSPETCVLALPLRSAYRFTHHAGMPTRSPHAKRQSRVKLPSSSIELIDSLPGWAKVLVSVIGVALFFYCIGHYGLGTTLRHAIFSP